MANENANKVIQKDLSKAVSYTHLRAHETPEHLVCGFAMNDPSRHRSRLEAMHSVLALASNFLVVMSDQVSSLPTGTLKGLVTNRKKIAHEKCMF